jgi:alpha-D-ribose 1-methylphosphonate 5-triphosphate synthase subunit PhnG
MSRNELHSDPQIAARQRWMSVLARAGSQLANYENALKDNSYSLIRAPETGMAMVRGRMGGTGSAFNLGEMTVTRCVVRLNDGRTGYSYITGRDKQHAELAALADAHLQGSDQQQWMARLIEPLCAIQQAQQAAKASETATTQVEFFTLVRGED